MIAIGCGAGGGLRRSDVVVVNRVVPATIDAFHVLHGGVVGDSRIIPNETCRHVGPCKIEDTIGGISAETTKKHAIEPSKYEEIECSIYIYSNPSPSIGKTLGLVH